MLDAVLNMISTVLGSYIFLWTVVTIIKTDGLFKYRYNAETDETEEVAD